MRSILLILLTACIATLPARAQRKLYKADPAAAAEIARAATSTGSTPEQKMVRENAVNEAFTELFKVSRVKDRDIERLMNLLAERKSLTDSLLRLQAAIAAREAELDISTETSDTDLETVQLHNDIAHLMTRINRARQGLRDAEAAYHTDSVNLAVARAEAEAAEAEVDRLSRIADADMANADVAKSMEGETVIEQLREAMAIPDRQLGRWDIARYTDAAVRFHEIAPLLDGDERAARLADSIATFDRHILPAATTIDKALAIMAGKYDEAEAGAAASSMTSLKAAAAGAPAMKPYRAEIAGVNDAMADYTRAYRNLTFLLTELQGMESGVPPDFDVNGFITSVVGIYAPGHDRYSSYYETFNTALDNLSRMVTPGTSGIRLAEIVYSISSYVRK